MLQVAAIALLFLAGVLLRQRAWLGVRHGSWLLRLVFNVGLPALILGSLSRAQLEPALVRLPLIACTVMLTVGAAAAVLARVLRLARPTAGALIVSAMAMNLAFVFPLVLALRGSEALARIVVFDIGNAVTQGTIVNLAAAHFGRHAAHFGAALRRVVTSPPFIAVVAAMLINHYELPVHQVLLRGLQILGQAIALLVVLAMGLLFEARHLTSRPVLATVSLRCGGGLAVAALAVVVSGTEFPIASLALVGSAGPIGLGALAMAEREGLDLTLTVAAASLSGLVALVLVPALLLVLP